MVGYARVSMSDQTNQRQVDDLRRAGVHDDDIFRDTASGKSMNRPGWKALWRDVRKGDVVVVLSIDRLGRNLIEVIQTVEALEKRGVGLKVLSGTIDTTTPNGRLMLALVAAMAQWERELIVERTQHGLARARGRGRVGGNKRKLNDKQVADAIKREKKGEFLADIAKEYGVGRNTLYKEVHKAKGLKGSKQP